MAWKSAIARLSGFTFMVRVDADHVGTGFIVGRHGPTMAIVSAWHVIKPLYNAENKFKRYVELHRAVGGTIVKANAVAIARIGSDEFDLGVVWIGPPMTAKIVDSVLIACEASQAYDGLIDYDGGGGVIEVVSPPERGLAANNATLEYLVESDMVPNETPLAWIGYPTDTLSNESGIVRVVNESEIILSQPSTLGMSGGPVFDNRGRVAGVMSSYNDLTNEAYAIPIEKISNMYGLEHPGFPFEPLDV